MKGMLLIAAVVALAVSSPRADAQLQFPQGPGICYRCYNDSETVQWCTSSDGAVYATGCQVFEDPVGSGVWMCST